MDTSTGTLRRWSGPLTIGVLDQATVSGANFALSILLARWMDPADYGAFTVGYSVLLLLSGPHTALLTDALSVVGPRRFAGRDLQYLRALLSLHAIVIAVMTALIAASAVVPALDFGPRWRVGLALAIAMVLTMWLIRAACYLESRPLTALSGGACYAMVLLIVVALARAETWLTPSVALGAMGVASIASSLWMAFSLGLLSSPWTSLDLATVVREHWAYGRWTLSASVAHGLANGLYPPVIATLIGLRETALLRAVQNLVLPLQQALTGVAMVAYPSMSRRVAEEGPDYVGRRGPAFVGLGVALTVLYGILVSVLARPVMSLLYGEGFYTDHASYVWLAAIAAVVLTLAQFLGILVRVVNRPQGVLWSKLVALVWFAAPGIWIVGAAGVAGAFWSLAAGALAEALVLLVVLFKRLSPKIALGPSVERSR